MLGKKKVWSVLSWSFIILAWAYLLYKLLDFCSKDSFSWAEIHISWWLVGIAVLLFPLNQLLEALKWRYLLHEVEPMTVWAAFSSTLFGSVGGFGTPYRLGDYPARVSQMEHPDRWIPAIALGLVGSFSLAFVQTCMGLIAFPFCFDLQTYQLAGYSVSTLALSLGLSLLCMLLIGLLPRLCRYLSQKAFVHVFEPLHVLATELAQLSIGRFVRICLWSGARILLYSFQLWLVLYACHIPLFGWNILLIPVYYMWLTLLPSLPAADAAVRGSVGIMLFAGLTLAQPGNTAQAALATMLLWAINTVLPMLAGTLLRFIPKR